MRTLWCFAALSVIGCGREHPPPRAPFLPEVYIEATADREGVVLERRYHDGEWSPVCTLPCRRTVRPDCEYRIGGDDIIRSSPFVIYEPATLDVHAGSRTSRAAGTVAAAIGIPLMFIGTFMAFFSFRTATGSDNGFVGPPWWLSATVLGLGTISTVGGLAALGNAYTQVDHRERRVAMTFKF